MMCYFWRPWESGLCLTLAVLGWIGLDYYDSVSVLVYQHLVDLLGLGSWAATHESMRLHSQMGSILTVTLSPRT